MGDVRTIAIDWDDTLVSYKRFGDLEHPGAWLDGAAEALRALLKSGFRIVIYSCRANWVEGLAEIVAKIRTDPILTRYFDRGDLKVWQEEGKPLAMVYLDDRGYRFGGDWTDMVVTLKELSRG